ncbi:GntR family transcriptional regulator [Glaciihabitans sp. UYNi722]|uniref:GntR family transcriptional regulator n=1 Tax=Glaciihabitans sp. UYNi722 TaxID=3156344 RepID=UPI00339549BB
MSLPGSTSETAAADRLEDSVEFAYRALRAEILSGALAPGAILSQVQLASRFDISRTPLREALRRLLAENLVVGDFNRRMRVSELNLDDFDQIYAIRIALEPVAIASTIAHLTAPSRAVLENHVTAMDEAIAVLDIDRFRDEHRAFHLGLTVGGGARVARLLEDLWDNSERYRLTYLHHDYNDPASEATRALTISQVEHRNMLNAALAGDATTCIAALLHHLQRALDIVYAEAAAQPRARVTAEALRFAPQQSMPA